MSRHREYEGTMPELFTDSIPVNEEVRRAQLEARLASMTDELETWQSLNARWGHVNYLIKSINDALWQLGVDEEIPEGLW